jgi:pyruvate-formate lyase
VRPLVAIPPYRMAGVFLDYEKLLRLGLPGLKAMAEASRVRPAKEGKDTSLFTGMLEAIDVVVDVCRFYRDQALAGAKQAPKVRSIELETLAKALDSFTRRPPETFLQALQLILIYTLLFGSLELGRMDIYLGPSFVGDIKAGVSLEPEADCYFTRSGL